MTDTRETVVDRLQDGARLDRALGAAFPDQSRSALARLIGNGMVRLDGSVVSKPSQRVVAGQRISIIFPEAAPASIESQDLPLEIIHQDDDIAVVAKPAGLVVHPAAGHPDLTLVNALLFHVGGLSGVGGEVRPGIVHRLDRDTSGVMVIAKHDEAHRRLTSSWNGESVSKEYLALVYGTPSPERGTVDAPIGRDSRDRKRMAVVATGRRALTDYETAELFRYVSLLRCRLRTGRTHQIRVHMKHLGHPIVGDPAYSGPQWRGIPDKRLQRLLGSFPRQALHAARLSFPHPRTGEMVVFEAPLPEDMRELLESLRRGQDR